MTGKNKGGRPLRFAKPEDLEVVLDEYFANTPQEEFTVTGLALATGMSKQLLNDYEGRDGYGDIVKRAKLRVENAYELSLRKNGKAGDIFGLKNFGWKDKRETEHSGNLTIDNIRKELYGEDT